MAENKKPELKVEISPEVAAGKYANLAMIAHGPTEFFLDFITVAPNMPQAKVVSRIILAPEHAKNLLMALNDNIARYEAMFGKIERTLPKATNGDDVIPNPFQA